MKHTISHAFNALQHSSEITNYLHSILKLRFRENGFDIGVHIKPSLHKTLVKIKMGF